MVNYNDAEGIIKLFNDSYPNREILMLRVFFCDTCLEVTAIDVDGGPMVEVTPNCTSVSCEYKKQIEGEKDG